MEGKFNEGSISRGEFETNQDNLPISTDAGFNHSPNEVAEPLPTVEPSAVSVSEPAPDPKPIETSTRQPIEFNIADILQNPGGDDPVDLEVIVNAEIFGNNSQ